MVFYHPKYYKELRKRNKTGVTATTKRDIGHSKELSFGFPPPVTSDQAISGASATAPVQRAPGPGLVCAPGRKATSSKHQATSHKLPGPRPISNANKGLIHRRPPSFRRQAR